MDKINTKIQKTIFNLILIVVSAITIIILFNSFEKDKDQDAQKLNSYFKSTVDQVASVLIDKTKKNHLTKLSLLNDELYSDWKIRIFENGKLTWWKDASLHHNATASKQVLYSYKKKFANAEVEIEFPIINKDRKNIKRKYIVDADCNYNYLVKETSKYELDFLTKKIGIYPSSKNINLQILRLVSVLFILLFFLIFVYLFHLFDLDNFKSLFLFYVICISFRFFALAINLFGSLGPLNTSSSAFLINVFNPTISDFFINGMLIFFLAASLGKFFDKKIQYQETEYETNIVLPIIMSLFLCISIIGFISFIKSWTFSTYLLFEIEEVFKTSETGILNISGILLLCVGLFMAHHTVYKSIFYSNRSFRRRMIIIFSSIVISCIIGYLLGIKINVFYLGLGLASYLILLDLFLDSKNLNITWLLWWIIVVSGFLSIFIFKYVSDHEQRLNKDYLKTHIATIDQKVLDQFFRIAAEVNNEELRSIASISYPLKMDRDDLLVFFEKKIKSLVGNSNTIGINCLDKDGSSIINDLPWNTETLIRRVNTAETVSDDLYFDPIENVYIKKYIIENENHPGSPFTLYISLIKSNENQLANNYQFPFSKGLSRNEFTFGVYKTNQLLYSNYDYLTFPKEIPNLKYDKAGYYIDNVSGYRRTFYKVNEKLSVGSIEEISDLIKPISLFSYLFSLLGVVLVLIAVINKYFKILPIAFSFDLDGTSLRDKIQFSVVSLIIISFIAIAVVTAYYFSQISSGYSETVLLDKINSVVNDTNDHENDGAIDIAKLGLVHRADILLYDEAANLISTTASLTDKSLRVPYHIFESLKSEPDKIEIVPNRIEQLNSIKTAFGKLTRDNQSNGFVQVLFPNNISTTIEIDDFLGTLLNVYVFLFIIAGVLAIAVANSVTNPIKKLGEKLSQFNLGKKNEPLKWDNKGEIGTLINEYNQLILKLEESANLIAKTERDTAWREMAKQVAHEIKNPLTSMKLSIQHLERAFSIDPVSGKNLIKKAANTLIEQIDNLSQIADEFSSFGKLPQGQNEKVVLNEIVSTIHDLFRKREDMDIKLAVPIDEIFVFADKNHLIRILNNLVKNAIQAIPSDRRGDIILNLYKDDSSAYIKVSDNGIGIPDHMFEKVFTPNFTTKSSGTGLGLAISANMIESFNGKIYFETEENVGTDFYIEIPLMRLEDNYKDENKVDLD